MTAKHFEIHVAGRVQGVAFRTHTQEQALALDLTGFVCNEADGSVYIEAEGEDENLQRFVGWCRQGPPLAEVSSLKVREGEPRHFTDFQITWHRL